MMTNSMIVNSILKVKKLSADAIIPTRGSKGAAGYDLYSASEMTVPAKGKAIVPTDLSIAVPDGTYGRVAPRSGLAVKKFIDVGAGVVDHDYRGPLGVVLFNFGEADFEVKKGDRIAQLVLEKIEMADIVEVQEGEDLDTTERGAGGFGSTGVSKRPREGAENLLLSDYFDEFKAETPIDFNLSSVEEIPPATTFEGLKLKFFKLNEIARRQHNLIKSLKTEYELESSRCRSLRSELDEVKKKSAEWHIEHEKEEEMITNRLLRRIDNLTREKNEIMTRMEHGEEFNASKLEKRLAQLEKEKLNLELALETESEYLVNRLGRKSLSPHSSNAGGLNGSHSLLTPTSSAPHTAAISGDPQADDDGIEKLKERLKQVEQEHLNRILSYEEQIKQIRQEIEKQTSR